MRSYPRSFTTCEFEFFQVWVKFKKHLFSPYCDVFLALYIIYAAFLSLKTVENCRLLDQKIFKISLFNQCLKIKRGRLQVILRITDS